MNFYKDKTGTVHALSDEDIANGGKRLLPAGCVPISEAEATPAPVVENPALAEIAAIEATITNRRLREAALTAEGKAWLAQQDAAIAALRAKL
jgi:hypothetical protein